MLACAAVFIALFVTNYFDFVKKVQENEYVEWDVDTITTGDYSIEFDITPDFFSDYRNQEMENWNKLSASEGRVY